MMTSGMIRGRWHCATVLACCLGAAVLQPGASRAQAPEDAQREKQIVDLKTTIDQLIKEAADVASGDTQKIIKQKVDELTATLAEVAKAQEIGVRVGQAIQAEQKAKAAAVAQAANAAAQSHQQLGVILEAQKAEVEKAVADQLLAQAKLHKLAEIQIGDDGKLAAEHLKLVQAKVQKLQQVGGDRQGLQAELKEAEMKLEQATKQAQDLKAKIREITAKMKAEAAAAAKGAASKEDSRIQLRLNLTTPDATEELLLRKVNGKWEVVPASKGGDQSRRSPSPRNEASPAPGRAVTVTPKIAEAQGAAGLRFRVEPKTPPAAAGSNSRIDELEKKIDKALQQVEQLRKQMNSRGKSGGRPEED